MNGFLISTTDRAGLAADLFEAAAARGVNVFPAFGLADGKTGIICVGSDNEAGLQGAIADAGVTATSVELVSTWIDNKPGTGAALFRKLANAGVNLLVAVPLGMETDRVEIGLGATDAAALKRALGS